MDSMEIARVSEAAARGNFFAPAATARFAKGFYECEWDDSGSFAWSRPDCVIEVRDAPRGRKALKLRVENIVRDPLVVDVRDGADRPVDRLVLDRRRSTHYVLNLPDAEYFELHFHCRGRVSDEIKGSDTRDLALKFYECEIYPLQTARQILESDCFVIPDEELDAVFLETTTLCNLKCLMCAQVMGTLDHKRHMDPEIVRRLLPTIARANTVDLHGTGESLLSPNFEKILELIPRPGPEVWFNSNGTTLTDESLELILSGRVHGISFSLDAATNEMYRLIRGADLDRVTANIRRLIEERDARGLSFPQIYINMTMMKMNIREAPALVDLAADLGANAVYLWHLNHNFIDADWKVERDGFLFDYREQNALLDPELANECVLAAEERARERGIALVPDHNRRYLCDTDSCDPDVRSTDDAPELAADADTETDPEPTLRELRLPFRELVVPCDGKLRVGCFQDHYYVRSLCEDLGEDDSPINCEEHLGVRYLLQHGRVPASYRGGAHQLLEGTCLCDEAAPSVFAVERHRDQAEGIHAVEDHATEVNLRFAWTGDRARITVPWSGDEAPLAVQLFTFCPEVGQEERSVRVLLEGKEIFQGRVGLLTEARDILLDWDHATGLRNRTELEVELQVDSFTLPESTSFAAKGKPVGIGLLAVAVV